MDNWASFRPKLEQAIRENPEQVKEGVNDFFKQFPDYKNILNF